MLRKCVHGPRRYLQQAFTLRSSSSVTRRYNSSDPQLKDVYVDSLGATLEAHRESNRAGLIRKTDGKLGDRPRTVAADRHVESNRSLYTTEERIRKTNHDQNHANKTVQPTRRQNNGGRKKLYPSDTGFERKRKYLDNEKALRAFGSYIEPVLDWVAPYQWTAERESRMRQPYLDHDAEPLTGLDKPAR